MVYTVDEVSVELSIPRPTVYRYLKEYSIPFSRRSGRIFVPEESIRKVRTVRELHDGGFGTEAVREKLRQGDDTELTRVTERLDKLTEAIERSRLEPGRAMEPARIPPDAHAVRMVLARQTILITAISNLAEMVGDLMAVNGLPRRPVLDYPEAESARRPTPLQGPNGGRSIVAPGVRQPPNGAASTLTHRRTTPPPQISPDKFGSLARRRRAMLTLALVALALLTVAIWRLY